VRRWQEFGFAGQFTPLIPVIQPRRQRSWSDYPPLFVSMPKKPATYENLNYSLGAGLGDSWSVYGTYWQFDFANWVAPDPACNAQHLPVGSVIFPQSLSPLRLFDALCAGFPPYPPLTNYTAPLLTLDYSPPSKNGG
jgi:hypothetical protein